MGDLTYFAALRGRSSQINSQQVVWSPLGGDRVVVLALPDAALLSHLATFKPWGEHLAAIIAATGMPAKQAEAALQRLRDLGIVQPLRHFLPAANLAPPAPAPLVCIRTCGRPDLLGALLHSLLEDERRCAVARDYVIVDDSPDPGSQAANEAVARKFARDSASEVRLLAASQQRSLLEFLQLEREATQSLLVRAGLSPASGGRAWNWALLLAAGGTLALLDDDFRFPLRRPPNAEFGFDLDTDYAVETEFLSSPDAVLQLPVIEEEAYTYLLRFLGQPPGALLRQYGFNSESSLGGAAGALSRLNAPAQVVGVSTGVYGALNYDSTVYLSGTGPATLASLFRPPFDQSRLNGDWLLHGRRRPQFMKTGVFTPLLLDARELLPPTGTYGKSDDGLFLTLLSVCDSRSLLVGTPAAIGHFPPPGRDRRALAERSAIEDISSFCAFTVMGLAPMLRSNDRGLRLAVIAAQLRDVAGSSDEVVARCYRIWRDHNIVCILQALHRNLALYGRSAPAIWIEHVGRAIRANEAELRERSIAPERVELARAATAQLAAALEVWPELWARAGAPLLAKLTPLG